MKAQSTLNLGFYVYCLVYGMCLRFCFRERHSIRHVGRSVGQDWRVARRLAPVDVRQKKPQPQAMIFRF